MREGESERRRGIDSEIRIQGERRETERAEDSGEGERVRDGKGREREIGKEGGREGGRKGEIERKREGERDREEDTRT